MLPSLDLHAHLDPRITSNNLAELRAVIFAVTRSLEEAQLALNRSDSNTVWGVGCHPSLVRAQKTFSAERFSKLLDKTPFAGELGLDGRSRLPLENQKETLRAALKILALKPRIVSLHSYAATEPLIDELEKTPIKGAVLHWWLGDERQTDRAVKLGCYFSMNSSSLRKPDRMGMIPIERLLTETDHPFGDRSNSAKSAPGIVEDVEKSIAQFYGLTTLEARTQIWRNLNRLTREVGCSQLFPSSVRAWLAVVPRGGGSQI